MVAKRVSAAERLVRGLVSRSGLLAEKAALAARYRSWHLTWGATDDEVSGPMPGDDLLDTASFVAALSSPDSKARSALKYHA